MIYLLRLHRANNADIVRNRTDVRKRLRDHLARRSKTLKLVLRGQTLENCPLKLGDGLTTRHGIGKWLAVELTEFRLVVQRLQMRGTAGHDHEDDSFGAWAGVQRLQDTRLISAQQLRIHERAERDAPHARGRPVDKRPTRNVITR